MTAIRKRIGQLESWQPPGGGDGCPECGGRVFLLRVTTTDAEAPPIDGAQAAPSLLLAHVRRCARCSWSESGEGVGRALPGQTTVRLPVRAESSEAWERRTKYLQTNQRKEDR